MSAFLLPSETVAFLIDFLCNQVYNKCIAKNKGGDFFGKVGRPHSINPKRHEKRIRMSDDEVEILEYCCIRTGKTQSDIIRDGIRNVYEKLKNEQSDKI